MAVKLHSKYIDFGKIILFHSLQKNKTKNEQFIKIIGKRLCPRILSVVLLLSFLLLRNAIGQIGSNG